MAVTVKEPEISERFDLDDIRKYVHIMRKDISI